MKYVGRRLPTVQAKSMPTSTEDGRINGPDIGRSEEVKELSARALEQPSDAFKVRRCGNYRGR